MQALSHYIRGWPILGVLVVTVWASFRTYDFVEYAIIETVYGADAWDSGLRVVDKRGRLSDGKELSKFHTIVLNGGSWLLSLPFFIGSGFGLAYINMRLHGKRLCDFARERDSP